jgi:hypothetical protein
MNLASHDLVMEIVQNSFIHNSYILHIENTFQTQIYRKM